MILTPETKLTFKAIKAFDQKSVTKIFLAGSIENGKAKNWQPGLAQTIQNKFGDNIIIFNPRRENWDPNAGSEIIKEQIEWELNAQEVSDIIVFYFDENTTSPITLLELGLAINSDKRILVWCPDAYYRFTNVYETLVYHDKESCLVKDDLEKAINDLIIELKNKISPPKAPFKDISFPYPKDPWKSTFSAKCYRCGLDLTSVMGYVCNDLNCPTFIKATY